MRYDVTLHRAGRFSGRHGIEAESASQAADRLAKRLHDAGISPDDYVIEAALSMSEAEEDELYEENR